MYRFLIRFCLALSLVFPFSQSSIAASTSSAELQEFKAQAEAKMEAAKEIQQKDFQLHQQLVASQNERIEQINHQVDWLGILITIGGTVITLLLVVIGYFAYGKAKNDAEIVAKKVASEEANMTSKAEVKKWFYDNLAVVNQEIDALKLKVKQKAVEVETHVE